MKKVLFAFALAIALSLTALVGTVLADHHESSWTGEVVDLACYVAQGAKGPDHADCAKACVKDGQPMGLLTDDGTLMLLAADPRNGEPFEELKNVAGGQATVQGSVAERDGMKVVTVKGAKAAG